MSKRLLLFTDAWAPQTNGVVTTLQNTVRICEQDHDVAVKVIHPGTFSRTWALPGYSEIRLAFPGASRIAHTVRSVQPEYIHIATEGPIGQAAARACKQNGWQYTTSFHTRFPEYVQSRVPWFPLVWTWAWLRRVHGGASAVLVTTSSLRRELTNNGFDTDRLVIWGRGVDQTLFRPGAPPPSDRLVLLNVGRVSAEKNLEAFLDIDIAHPGGVEKRVVGDGPALDELKNKYQADPTVVFVGKKTGEDLVEEYQNAHVFVFPSQTDTYGLVQIEAMCCGTPVAAYPVPGPIDIITAHTGAVQWNLGRAVEQCLIKDRQEVARSAKGFTWESATDTFVSSLTPMGDPR